MAKFLLYGHLHLCYNPHCGHFLFPVCHGREQGLQYFRTEDNQMKKRIILILGICILAFTVFMVFKTVQAYNRYQELLQYEEELQQEIDEILQEKSSSFE